MPIFRKEKNERSIVIKRGHRILRTSDHRIYYAEAVEGHQLVMAVGFVSFVDILDGDHSDRFGHRNCRKYKIERR